VRAFGQAVNRPVGRHVNGAAAEVDGASHRRRGEEAEQHKDRDGWTKQAHTRPTIAASNRFGQKSGGDEI
jgi:hypothetical protein